MKLYAVSDGPPSLCVIQLLKYLDIPFELININYNIGEHMTEEYAKLNPQKEIPVLDDDGFLLGESIAMLQYICDKYRPDSNIYPKDPQTRAIVNHRLCFNMSTYYAAISEYGMAPIFYDYERTPLGLKKVHIALNIFNTYLERTGKKYAAADHITIADFALVCATMCLEAIEFDFSKYGLITKWYNTFKKEYPELWKVANGAKELLIEFAKNPPDLSSINHPIHPVRKNK